jgi:hypothetical protein
MVGWNDKHILVPEKPLAKQDKLIEWVLDNVDFGVPTKRVE